jgi:hypothetical protein
MLLESDVINHDEEVDRLATTDRDQGSAEVDPRSST